MQKTGTHCEKLSGKYPNHKNKTTVPKPLLDEQPVQQQTEAEENTDNVNLSDSDETPTASQTASKSSKKRVILSLSQIMSYILVCNKMYAYVLSYPLTHFCTCMYTQCSRYKALLSFVNSVYILYTHLLYFVFAVLSSLSSLYYSILSVFMSTIDM